MAVEAINVTYNVTYFDDTKNRYRVPKKQWSRWNEDQRRVFNHVHSAMTGNQDLFMHPKAEPVPVDHWKTTSWNAAWEAATASG